ncbi:sodium:solute symporter [Aliidongia dinghuensis]|uniref:Sodium:solute symporter n=1 Tax=Aliidongia dinghuensis TaxID=1867774 RepID=A0A8J2YXA7_9PROT|nr:sodium:solute symporter [Aliidongia dinghuensis]GGF34012.1 sodium:solute symporter [Aliidongia dinghuensis]
MSTDQINWTALVVFILFFALVTVLGFVAARWKAGDLSQLHEWGLGGRRFGTIITWFLVGGDFYTAYTVIAVPALVYAVGAYGFFALPYTIIVYPLVFLVMPRLWAVCQRHQYVTGADFIHGRYGSAWLALAVALTGLLATMPYIALQLVGMQVVIGALGLGGEGIWGELPLIIAFVILAVYTYASGLRAPAMIAFVKDVMIYIVVIAAIAIIPLQLGGYGAVFDAADKAFQAKGSGGLILAPGQFVPFATLALGSAFAAFMYPHTMTGVLSSSSGDVVRKNAMLLPAYTVLLGLIAMLGYMGIAAGITVKSPTQIVPALFLKIFPDWFVGFSFAAIAIGALVPAAIMSIGAANLFTRNVWRTFVNPNITPQAEAASAKLVSLIVKFGALVFIVALPTQFAIDLQLLGGVWILQTFPAIVLGLYKARLRPQALLLGWAVGMVLGTWLASLTGLKPVYPLVIGGATYPVYIGVIAGAVNIVVSVVASALFGVLGLGHGSDQTQPEDYQLTKAS